MPVNEHDTIERNRRGWNTISAQYQANTRISTDDVHYGPLAPGERELGLLGDVAGKRVIEIGCGGGQNSVALAKWGATCVGIDPSPAQLVHARQLALEEGVQVRFFADVAEDLSDFPDDSFDLALSSYAFDYVTDLRRAYGEAWRVLKPGGLFVFCLSHPWFQAVGWHLAGEPDAPEIGNYAAWPDSEEWNWNFDDGTTALMRGHLRTVQQLVNELIGAGFTLERLMEQGVEDVEGASPEELARYPYIGVHDPASGAYQIMRKLPLTLIIRARKTEGSVE
jgi:ubiquinone/menaquinone biosynthesis C-methylase UbiE